MRATRKDAYQLFHQGMLALSQIEANGMKIDTKQLDKNIVDCTRRCDKMLKSLQRHEVGEMWQAKYGAKTNFNSRQQLGSILFESLGYQGTKTERAEEEGVWSTDKEFLSQIDHPFVRKYMGWQKLLRINNTVLQGIKKRTVDGYLHPIFNLHLATTYRSSCEDPNSQNIPVRDPECAELIRSCIIASSKKHCILESDFSGIEVRVSSCYNKDPQLIKYITDPTTDMHRDMACECYMLTKEEVTKQARYAAKNKFVFPSFYGSYFGQCAPNLWRAIDELKLVLPDGTPLKDHLKHKKIRELGSFDPNEDREPKPGTFYNHIKNVEKNFWEERFKVYTQWKKDWFEAYTHKGYFDLYTGFRCSGVMKRNDVLNYPIQGAAFHCLLWCLTKLHKWLKKNKMKTKIIGQIHDSMILDVYLPELQTVKDKIVEICTVSLLKHYDWIIVPMGVEIEYSPPGGSWFEKGKAA